MCYGNLVKYLILQNVVDFAEGLINVAIDENIDRYQFCSLADESYDSDFKEFVICCWPWS